MGLLVLFFAVLLASACRSNDTQGLQKVVKGNEVFTANFYKELIKTKDSNIILSGWSAEVVLSLLADGAKGQTQSQLLTALGLPESQQQRDAGFKQLTASLSINTDKLKLLSANKIYPAKGFAVLPSFNKVSVDVYKAEVQNLDYKDNAAAADTINKWVENRTQNKIKDLIKSTDLSGATKLVLVNALFLNATWVHPFELTNTKKRPFYTTESDSKEIETMYTEANVKYTHCSGLKAKFLELDFKDGNISMVFVLPDAKTGLGDVEERVGDYLKPQKLKVTRVGITIPKYTITTDIDLKPILQTLGVDLVFTSSADLTGIADQGLQVDFVKQKALIEVTETGVVAAAATAGGISLTSVPLPPKITFTADHPFFFYIKENESGAILFAGRFNGLNS